MEKERSGLEGGGGKDRSWAVDEKTGATCTWLAVIKAVTATGTNKEGQAP